MATDSTDIRFDHTAALAVVVEYASPRRFVVLAGTKPAPAPRH